LKKKRVSVWIQGGIGGGLFSQGFPAIQQQIKRLAARYDVDIYSQLPANSDFIPEGFRFYTLNRKVKSGALRWIYLLLIFLYQHIRRPYKVLFGFWGYPAGAITVALGKIFRRPSIVSLHGGDSVCIPSIPYGVFCDPGRTKICRWAYAHSTVLLTVSQYQASVLKQYGITKTPRVIPYGTDPAIFPFKEKRFDAPVVRFIHIGNHTPIKDQRTLLQAFSIVTKNIPAKLTIVGPDFFGGQLKMWSIELGIENHVDFVEPLPNGRLFEYYHQADIMLHTSLYEAQGLVFTEAAGCGTLLAGTRVGQLADMGDTRGIIVEPGEAALLAQKIIDALVSPEYIYTMRMAAFQWAQQFNADYTEQELTNIIDKLSS